MPEQLLILPKEISLGRGAGVVVVHVVDGLHGGSIWSAFGDVHFVCVAYACVCEFRVVFCVCIDGFVVHVCVLPGMCVLHSTFWMVVNFLKHIFVCIFVIY